MIFYTVYAQYLTVFFHKFTRKSNHLCMKITNITEYVMNYLSTEHRYIFRMSFLYRHAYP